MAKHNVKVNIPKKLELGNSDIEFHVFEDGAKLGTLRVSKGTPVWISKHGQKGKKTEYKKSWQKIMEFFEKSSK